MENCLEVFRDLKDKDLRQRGLFIAEGPSVVRQLLNSKWQLHSLLVSEALSNELLPLVSGRCPVFTCPEREISQIVGYPFHRGVLAAGVRPSLNEPEFFLEKNSSASCVVVAPLVTELENLGTIIRNSAALGADCLMFGLKGCDPYSRRVIRVSMGAVFKLPLVPIADSVMTSSLLKQYGFEIVATVLRDEASLLKNFHWPAKTALLLGNETEGIMPEWLSQSTQSVTIPMSANIDSLNLGVASGIFLFSLASSQNR